MKFNGQFLMDSIYNCIYTYSYIYIIINDDDDYDDDETWKWEISKNIVV